MKFQTNVCPLCDKVLKLHQISKVNTYRCPKLNSNGKSHYEVEFYMNSAIQHIYINDWAIDNLENIPKSRLYKTINNKWCLVSDNCIINADTEEKILFKINKHLQSNV
jgi:hypothetical protein